MVSNIQSLENRRGILMIVAIVVGLPLSFWIQISGPDRLLLASLVYGPLTKGALLMAVVFLLFGTVSAIARDWVGASWGLFGSALFAGCLGYGLAAATETGNEHLAKMVSADAGCMQSHVVEAFERHTGKKERIMKMCTSHQQ